MREYRFHVLFLCVICCFSFFINNGVIYADIMESRNLVTAREIAEGGDWLVPTMNGELRLEKPPLPTWVAAGVELLSADNLPLQRSAAGAAATLLVFFLYRLAARQSGSRLFGLTAAVCLCTSFNLILMGRTATWDVYCHCFMLGAIAFLFRAGEKEGRCWREFLCAGALMGLSFLGKGPVAFYALLLPFVIAWVAVYRPSFRGKWAPAAAMAGVCLVISLWWPALLYFTHREMVLAVWNKESAAWLEHSVRPWWYYWKFFAESGVWALFLLTALVWPYWKRRVPFGKAYLFSVCWVFMILVLLSLLPEKKSRYLLPIVIPSALAVAHLLFHWRERVKGGAMPKGEGRLWRANALCVAAVAGVLPVGIYVLFYRSGQLETGYFVFLALWFGGVAAGLFHAALRRRIPGFLGGVLLLFLGAEVFVLPSVAGIFNNPDVRSIRAVREIPALDGLPFYHDSGEELRIEIVYEAGRRILPYPFRERDSLPSLPFVLVSGPEAGEVLPERFLGEVDLSLVGIYDDNKRAVNSVRSPKFVRRVTLVRPK